MSSSEENYEMLPSVSCIGSKKGDVFMKTENIVKNAEPSELKTTLFEIIQSNRELTKSREDQAEEILKFKKIINESEKEKEGLKLLVENLQAENVSSKEKLAKLVTCPVCFLVPRDSTIPICLNGHITCKTCKRLTCPTCRTEMGDSNSPIALSITEFLEFPCENEEKGCTVSVLKAKLRSHENVCRFKDKIPCPGLKCHKTFSYANIEKHLEGCDNIIMSETAIQLDSKISEEIDSEEIKDEGNNPSDWFTSRGYRIEGRKDIVFLTIAAHQDIEGEENTVFMLKLLSEGNYDPYSVRMEVSNLTETISKSFMGETVSIEVDKTDETTTKEILGAGNAVCVLPRVLNKMMNLNDSSPRFKIMFMVKEKTPIQM